MDTEERSLDPLFRRSCEECGAPLAGEEVAAALEVPGPFLCSVHAAELAEAEGEEEAS